MSTSKLGRLSSSRLAFVTFATLLVTGLGVVSTAAAAPPTRDPSPLPADPFTITDTLGNDPCGFEVQAQLSTNKEKLTTFTRRGGATLVTTTGALKVQLTNLETGDSIKRNISGPTFSTTNAAGSVTQKTAGPGLWALDPGVAPELPRLVITTGKTESVFEPTFRFVSRQGSYEDICAALS